MLRCRCFQVRWRGTELARKAERTWCVPRVCLPKAGAESWAYAADTAIGKRYSVENSAPGFTVVNVNIKAFCSDGGVVRVCVVSHTSAPVH